MFAVDVHRERIALLRGAAAEPFDPRRTVLLLTAEGPRLEAYANPVRGPAGVTLDDLTAAMARTLPADNHRDGGVGWWVTHTEPRGVPAWLGGLLVAVRLYREPGGPAYGVYRGRRHYFFHEVGGALAAAAYLHEVPGALGDAIDRGAL